MFLKISAFIDSINIRIGKVVQWLTISLVLIQFSVVVLRYIYGFNSTIMQESILWIYGIMVFCSSSWAYLLDTHVRVDVAYQGFNTKRKAIVDIMGAIFLMLPLLVVLWIYVYPYVMSSWRILEKSFEADGIPAVYILKSFLLLFVVQMFLQTISEIIKKVHVCLECKVS